MRVKAEKKTELEEQWENAILKDIQDIKKKIKMGYKKTRTRLGGGITVEYEFDTNAKFA